METTKCLGCGATVFVKREACPRCGFTRHTTTTQQVAFGVTIVAIGALMFYGMWSLIPQVMASM
jgi:hypothetical protein